MESQMMSVQQYRQSRVNWTQTFAIFLAATIGCFVALAVMMFIGRYLVKKQIESMAQELEKLQPPMPSPLQVDDDDDDYYGEEDEEQEEDEQPWRTVTAQDVPPVVTEAKPVEQAATPMVDEPTAVKSGKAIRKAIIR